MHVCVYRAQNSLETYLIDLTRIIIFLLLDEWDNFIERLGCKESELWDTEENILQLRHWASLRGQTLCRTSMLSIVTSCLCDFHCYKYVLFLQLEG